MDGVVTVADAINGASTLDGHFEAVSQAAMADLILISKADVAVSTQVERLEARLRDLNSTATIMRAKRGKGIGDKLWGHSGIHFGVQQDEAIRWLDSPKQAELSLSNVSGLAIPAPFQPSTGAHHDGRIASASIVLEAPLSADVFDAWLKALITRRGANILRVKGIVFLKDMEAPFVFHGVQHVFDPPIPVKNWQGNDRRSRIVVIARDVTEAELQSSFDMLRTSQHNAHFEPGMQND